MKKTFIKVALLCAFLFSVPLSFVSCTDYGKDIERIDSVDKDLTSQLSALQAALTASKAEIDAAKVAAEQAKSEANVAKAEAELAKQAAAQAKTEAIAAAITEVNKLMEKAASKEEVKAVAARIDGIEKGLNTLTNDLDDVKSQQIKFDEALKNQIAALEAYKTLVNQQLTGISANVTDINNKVNNLIAELNTVKAEMATKTELTTTKAELEQQIKNLSAKINETLGARIDTLIRTLISRISSITLIPNVYIDGIPAIDFRSVEYTPKKFDNGNIINIPGAKRLLVSNGKTTAKYRLNPMGIEGSDIVSEGENRPAFMEDIAETRSAVRKLIDVESFEVKDGVMTVFAKKADGYTGSLELTGDKVNIVSLRLTNKNLLEGETAKDATVYSEYVRLAETTFSPVIAAVPYKCPSKVNHYNDSTTLYTSVADNLVDVEANYIKGINLNDVVAGCYIGANGDHVNITREELKAYGLEFRFAVAKSGYILGAHKTNQQEFAKLDDNGHLTSKLPNGEVNNEAAIDKQPIIRVVLVDTKNGNLVDQRYIKVKFNKERQPNVDLGSIYNWTKVLGCDEIALNFTWDQMTSLVYGKLNNGGGMSKADFAKIYTQFTFTGSGAIDNYTDMPDAGTDALVWTLTADDLKKILPETSKTFEVVIKFSDPRQLYGDLTFKFTILVNINLPKVNGYNEGYWKAVGTILRITPIHLTDPNRVSNVCEYNSNIWNAFTKVNGTLIKNIASPCGSWDMQFAVVGQLAGFKPGNVTEPASNSAGYSLFRSGSSMAAATLKWEASHAAWGGIPTNTYTNITLDKNNGGKDLIGKNIKVGIWGRINPYNQLQITKFDLEIVKPLNINNTLKDATFYDHVYGGSKISCGEAFTMTDFAKYIVAKVSKVQYAEELYKYYEVQDPTWDIINAKVGMKMSDGNLVIDDALTAANSNVTLNATSFANSVSKSGDLLIFNNNSGLNVETPFNIFIKAMVVYGWGTTEEWVTIRVKPSASATRKQR